MDFLVLLCLQLIPRWLAAYPVFKSTIIKQTVLHNNLLTPLLPPSPFSRPHSTLLLCFNCYMRPYGHPHATYSLKLCRGLKKLGDRRTTAEMDLRNSRKRPFFCYFKFSASSKLVYLIESVQKARPNLASGQMCVQICVCTLCIWGSTIR